MYTFGIEIIIDVYMVKINLLDFHFSSSMNYSLSIFHVYKIIEKGGRNFGDYILKSKKMT